MSWTKMGSPTPTSAIPRPSTTTTMRSLRRSPQLPRHAVGVAEEGAADAARAQVEDRRAVRHRRSSPLEIVEEIAADMEVLHLDRPRTVI